MRCLSKRLTAAAMVAAVATASAAATTPAGPHIVFHIDARQITESSSLVVSTAHAGLVYTANDSGDGPYIYVLDDAGHLVGTTTLSGVDAVDVEAMADGSDGSLVLGDIGDNDADRSSVQIYKIPQPTRGDHTVKPDTVTLKYADGARNAESLLYDAGTDTAFVLSKELLGHVYSTPAHVFARSTATLERGLSVSSYATDASWLPAHDAVVVRGYTNARVYRYPSWKLITLFSLPAQKQGESIANLPGRRGVVWVGSEGANSPVWEVPLPALPPSSTSSAGPVPYTAPGAATFTQGGAGRDAVVTKADGFGSTAPEIAGLAACALALGAGVRLLSARPPSRRSASAPRRRRDR